MALAPVLVLGAMSKIFSCQDCVNLSLFLGDLISTNGLLQCAK